MEAARRCEGEGGERAGRHECSEKGIFFAHRRAWREHGCRATVELCRQADVELEAKRTREMFGPVLAKCDVASDSASQLIEKIPEGARMISVGEIRPPRFGFRERTCNGCMIKDVRRHGKSGQSNAVS